MPNSSEDDAVATEYSLYLKTRDDYLARERAAAEKTDQVLLAGAAGALALSLTFLEKIAPHPVTTTKWMLGASWCSLLVSLAGGLLAFELRAQGYALAARKLDEAQDIDKMDMKWIRRCNRGLLCLKVVSLIALFAGVALLVLFAFSNVHGS